MMEHRFNWFLIVFVMNILKLLSITTADEGLNSNKVATGNESSFWEHLKVRPSKPLENVSIINDSYTLNKAAIHDTVIRLESTSLFIWDTIFIGSKILASGKMDYSVFIENSVFEISEIIIDSASNVTIVHSHFILEDIGKEEEPSHVVKVYNIGILFMNETYFGNQSIQDNDTGHSEMKNSTNLGIALENVSITVLRGCTFTGIKAENSNGSAILLKNSDILMISCHLYLNMVKYGVVFGNNFANITTRNSSFTYNYASDSGAVFYLSNACSLTNYDSIFQYNSAREHAGVVCAMYDVTINNRGCIFQHNLAETGNGSAIWMRYNCQITNRQVLLSKVGSI